MKKLLFLFALILVSCSGEEQGNMQLTIVNNHTERIFKEVSLQDYFFDELEIGEGDSRTFKLYNGIPSGGLDIGVRLLSRCRGMSWNDVIRVDFEDGKNTIITIKSVEEWGCAISSSIVLD